MARRAAPPSKKPMIMGATSTYLRRDNRQTLDAETSTGGYMLLGSRRSPRGHLPAMYRYCTCPLLGFVISGCASVANSPNSNQRPASDSSFEKSAGDSTTGKSPPVSTTERSPAEPGTTNTGTGDGAQAARVAGGVAVGAAGGAVIGGLMGLSCGIGAIICSPVGAAIGAVAGGVTLGQKVAASHNGGNRHNDSLDNKVSVGLFKWYGPLQSSELSLQRGDMYVDNKVGVGPFKGYGPLQSGDMYVDTRSIRVTDVPPKRTAHLIVDVGYEMSSSGEASTRAYGVEAVVDCPNPRFSISLRTKWPGVFEMGRWYYVEDITPRLLIGDDTNSPDTTLKAAADIVCKS